MRDKLEVLETLEYVRDYCRLVICKDCEFRQNDICLIQAITGGQPPCHWNGGSSSEEDKEDDTRDAEKEEQQYFKDFKEFCRIENHKRYLDARELWYQRHFGRSRQEQLEIYYWAPRKPKKRRKSYGDENFLWFNPNEFEGF